MPNGHPGTDWKSIIGFGLTSIIIILGAFYFIARQMVTKDVFDVYREGNTRFLEKIDKTVDENKENILELIKNKSKEN